VISASLFASSANANDGDPVAVRRWPDGAISIETHWGLHVVIDPSERTEKLLPRKPDLIVRSDEKTSLQLGRKPNQEKPALMTGGKDPNSVTVNSISSGDGEAQLLSVRVDGTSIVFVPHQVLADDSVIDVAVSAQQPDLLVLSTSDASTLEKANVTKFATDVRAKRILLNVSAGLDKSVLSKFQAAIGTKKPVTTVGHNTLAISKPVRRRTLDRSRANDAKPGMVEVITLTDKPWKMPEDLSKLFVAMEKSSRDSQKVFAKLSANQMNFKPSNGTHTPRWNTEHMMGRQLQFFSQIYNKIDPAIPVMNLNPRQMPEDYRFAHPDWDGKEEARQMQRVSEFTRRFAYLLDGLDVNKRVAGSPWPSLRALLEQMFRHYSEHTANTVKKFSLPGFPEK
jgi:hypothetical protein